MKIFYALKEWKKHLYIEIFRRNSVISKIFKLSNVDYADYLFLFFSIICLGVKLLLLMKGMYGEIIIPIQNILYLIKFY